MDDVSRPDPIVTDKLSSGDSALYVLPGRCAGERATHRFTGAIATLDAPQQLDSVYLVHVLTRITETLPLPTNVMHEPVLGEIVVVIGRDGRLERFEARSAGPAGRFATAAGEVLGVLRFEGAVDPLPREFLADSLVVFLTYETTNAPPFGFARDFRAALPSELAVITQAGQRPVYPDTLRSDRVGGGAILRFVVDTLGHADMRTVQATTTHEAFAQAAIDVLPSYAFRPARIGACPLRTVVELPFVFAVDQY